MADKKATTAGTQAPWVRLLIDFGPLLAFFAGFKFGGMFVATGVFMVATVAAMIASRILNGHIAATLKFTFVVVMVMGGLTLWLQDETFVKMKLTVLNCLFAVILLFGLLTGRLYIKMLMGMALEMRDEGWHLFTRNYALFLLVMAAVNEAIWRTQSDDFWVNFKTFGYMGAMMAYLIVQMPALMKYMPEEKKGDD
ncbi:MAG: septation protein IspZ [Alphaproteobacteria bacterium]|nr:MAG: septation protein IspZ [Alphaproteobacteria bacterium]